MKKVIIGIILGVSLSACSESDIGELVLRETLKDELTDLCADDQACIKAVETQLKTCIKKSGWKQFFENQDDEAELARFAEQLYGCIVDQDGEPFFESNL